MTDKVQVAGEGAMSCAWWGHLVDNAFMLGASTAFFLNGAQVLFGAAIFFKKQKALDKEKPWEFSRDLTFILTLQSELSTVF